MHAGGPGFESLILHFLKIKWFEILNNLSPKGASTQRCGPVRVREWYPTLFFLFFPGFPARSRKSAKSSLTRLGGVGRRLAVKATVAKKAVSSNSKKHWANRAFRAGSSKEMPELVLISSQGLRDGSEIRAYGGCLGSRRRRRTW